MKKILVTGSNGLLGQKITDALHNRSDIQLIATARGVDRYPHQQGYIYESMDISSRSSIETVLDKHLPDAIIHTAAMTMVDDCEKDHETCDLMNVTAVEFLADACKQRNIHLVHVSTDFIFDGTHGPLKEDETPNPLSYYGLSKLKGEEIVKRHAGTWAILRTVLVFGVVNDMSRSNVVLWVKKSLEAGKDINVVDDQFRTPTLAEDLAQGCIRAAEQHAQGIFNVSGKEFMSIYDLAHRVAEYWNLDRNLIHRSSSASINQPAKRPPITGFNIEKAIRILGYQPHSFREGLELLDRQLKETSA